MYVSVHLTLRRRAFPPEKPSDFPFLRESFRLHRDLRRAHLRAEVPPHARKPGRAYTGPFLTSLLREKHMIAFITSRRDGTVWYVARADEHYQQLAPWCEPVLRSTVARSLREGEPPLLGNSTTSRAYLRKKSDI